MVESCDVNPCGLDERCGIQAGSYVCVDDCSGNDTHAVCNLPGIVTDTAAFVIVWNRVVISESLK